MGTRGPLPKDPEKRQRRNASPATVEIPADARAVRVPALPGSKNYRPEVRRWYRTWSRSPQASLFTETDWQRLHMTAQLVDEYYRRPSAALLAEIRANETKLGATPDDRQRLRWSIVDDEEAAPAETVTRSRRKPDPRRHLTAVPEPEA
jgi:hypothetical protein